MRQASAQVLFATPHIIADRKADGSIWLKSAAPLQPFARCVGDWLEQWARETPDTLFLAERSSADLPWSKLTYREALRRVRAAV